MTKLCDNGTHVADLLHNLKTVERSIDPCTDANVILLPAACIMSECSLVSNADLLRPVNKQAPLFVKLFTTLEEVLLVYAEFHIMILKGQAVKWSKEHSFKCNYQHFCQWASCLHGLLCTMLCKPTLVVPAQYLGLGVHSRGKHGRPSCDDQGEDEEGETAGCRYRIQQSKGYTVPKTTAQLETVESEDDVPPAPRAPNRDLGTR